MRRLNLSLLAVASVVLFVAVSKMQWGVLAELLFQGGRFLPLLLLPYAVTCFFWALSWRFLLTEGGNRATLPRLFFLRLAGEALNQLTPAATFGGEPFKAAGLHAAGVRWAEAAASVAIQKVLMVLSLVLYVVAALLLLPLAVPGLPLEIAMFSWLGTLALAVGGSLFLFVQRRNPCVSLVRLLRRFRICPPLLSRHEERLACLDAALAEFYRDHLVTGAFALLLFFLGWAMHAVEVYLIFIAMGHPITFQLAFCLDALAQLAAGVGFMIPASLGVQDGGNILLSLGFKLGATTGAGFSILRRCREAFWLLLGLLVVASEGKRKKIV